MSKKMSRRGDLFNNVTALMGVLPVCDECSEMTAES